MASTKTTQSKQSNTTSSTADSFFSSLVGKLKALSVPKLLGLLALGVVSLFVLAEFSSFQSPLDMPMMYREGGIGGGGYSINQSAPAPSGTPSAGYDGAYYEEDMAESAAYNSAVLPPIDPGYATGGDAERYEVKEYYGEVRADDVEGVCGQLESLKALGYVIFEHAQKNENNCSYRFKVTQDRAAQILSIVEALDPYQLTTTTYSIKRSVDATETEVEILRRKLDSIEQTLSEALVAYEDITNLASNAGDIESLAKIIDSRVGLIERLTRERIAVRQQIERFEQAQLDQLDRLNYTFFTISVYKYTLFDFKELKDSWFSKSREFVGVLNTTIQGLTVGLLGYALQLVLLIVYGFLLLLLAKFGWRVVRNIWNA